MENNQIGSWTFDTFSPGATQRLIAEVIEARKGGYLSFDSWNLVNPELFASEILKWLRGHKKPKPWTALKRAAAMLLGQIAIVHSTEEWARARGAASWSPSESRLVSYSFVELVDYVLEIPPTQRGAPKNPKKYDLAVEFEAANPGASPWKVSKAAGVNVRTIQNWRTERQYNELIKIEREWGPIPRS